MCGCSISENQSLAVMRPWWNLWLIGAVVISMCLHFVILEINFLAVSLQSTMFGWRRGEERASVSSVQFRNLQRAYLIAQAVTFA